MKTPTKQPRRSCVTLVEPEDRARAQAIVVDFDSLLDGILNLPDPECRHLAAYDPVRSLFSIALGADSILDPNYTSDNSRMDTERLPFAAALMRLPEDTFKRARELMPDSWRDPDSEHSKTPEHIARRMTWDHSLDPNFPTHLTALLDDIPPTTSPNVADLS